MTTIKKLISIAEENDWDVRKYSDEIEIQKYSPEGQDFFVTLPKTNKPQELISALEDYIDGYDPWDEAQLWIRDGKGQNGAPEDPEDVLADMKACKSMMKELLDIWKAEAFGAKISTYTVSFSPEATVTISVTDPCNPSEKEFARIVDEAVEKIKDNIEDMQMTHVALNKTRNNEKPLEWPRPIYPYPDCDSFANAYASQTKGLLKQALGVINNYSGDKLVTLPSGEKAVDLDESWVIINKEGSFLRDKRDIYKEDVPLCDLTNELNPLFLDIIFGMADYLSNK